MIDADHTRQCRFCRAPLTHVLVDLGQTALANRNLRRDEIDREKRYPLIVRVCGHCFLVQVDDSVPPDAIFSDYDYFSSYSDSWVAHAASYAADMIVRFGVGPTSQVIEVASNDGYLLQHFVKAGIPVLGIEPAANVVEVARRKNVPTEVAFFGAETARGLVSRGIRADLTVANNVLAHVPAINDFVSGFADILKPEGVATFEFPHLLNLLERLQFDTIYHEHFSYLSLLTTERIFAANNLRVFDVEEIATHGGSLRLFVCRRDAAHETTSRVITLRQHEHEAGLDTIHGYEGFADKVEGVKRGFREFLAAAKAEGRSIAAYGAAAKGNTFLNVCGTTAADIVEVYDRSDAKQGKILPGTHIPIVDPARMQITKPDYLLVLPWNLLDEIKWAMSHLREWGGQFVVAIPRIQRFDA
jgi:SAM-dependent methyltransferase